MQKSTLLTSIGSGRPVIGTAHLIRDESVSETLRGAPLDFVLIDMQHIAITIETLQRVLAALQPTELSVLVRTLSNDPTAIGQVLDAGANGVVIPMINTAEDAERAVRAAKFPPEGTRSWGPRRAAPLFGGISQFARDANDSAVVFIQVETTEAIANLDPILSVPGLSGVLIGPADIAIAVGAMEVESRNDPVVIDTIQGVLDRCLERDVPFGIIAPTIDSAVHWLERGALVVSCSADTAFIAQGVSQVAGALESVRDARRTTTLSGQALSGAAKSS